RVSLKGALDGSDVTKRNPHRIFDEHKFRTVKRPICYRKGAFGFSVEGILSIENFVSLRPLRLLRDLDGRFHGFSSRRAEENHVEIGRRDFGEIVGERCCILRWESHRNLMTLLLLKPLSSSKHPRMIMAKPKRTEAAKKIEDLLRISCEVVHALGLVDDDAV